MQENNKKVCEEQNNSNSITAKTNSKKLENTDLNDINRYVASLKQRNLSYSEIFNILNQLLNSNFPTQEDIILPASVFDNEILSSLELIVKYLHENLGLKFSKIAKIIGRNNIALANCYRITTKKHPSKLNVKPSFFTIPSSILKNRNLSVLENISYYLKNNYKLTYHDVAILLRKNDRTIWTVYQRALKKLGESKLESKKNKQAFDKDNTSSKETSSKQSVDPSELTSRDSTKELADNNQDPNNQNKGAR